MKKKEINRRKREKKRESRRARRTPAVSSSVARERRALRDGPGGGTRYYSLSASATAVAGPPSPAAAADAARPLPNIETDCPSLGLVDLTAGLVGAPVSADGSVTVDGLRYRADSLTSGYDRVFGCLCELQACLPLCARKRGRQSPIAPDEAFFPVYDWRNDSRLANSSSADFWQFQLDPCHDGNTYVLMPERPDREYEEFRLLSNGSILMPVTGSLHNYSDYCVGLYKGRYRVNMSFKERKEPAFEQLLVTKSLPVAMLISVPFLVSTFAVYMLIPELRNIHGLTLCLHIVSLIAAYTMLATLKILPPNSILNRSCNVSAYIVHFSFLASFFWLNVMCFDIWWTFGGFRSLHGSVKQRERKKFIMYSIYAWGSATLITAFCMIMDLVPGIPASLIKPEFGKGRCWFEKHTATFLYFYLPMGLTIICNICLFVLTALKIRRHKKDTARQLRGSESRRHDDNKQWFNLYLKLFIVMGINWSTEIISWIFKDKLPGYVWYITDLTNTLQGVIIFVIFVWKDKIKRLLMKRFGCQGNGFLSRHSTTRSGCPTSSASRTTCLTAAALQEKANPYTDTYRGKATAQTDESDCI